MADTIICYQGIPGLALTLDLYPEAKDAERANGSGDSFTEDAESPGTYFATVAEALAGTHKAVVKSGSTVISNGWVNSLTDTTDTFDIEQSRKLDAAVSSLNPAGTGIHTLTVTVTDGTDPILGASLRVALNGGANGEYPDVTDASGEAAVPTNAGTVTVYASAPGYASNSAAKVVSGDDTLTVELDAIATPVAGDNQSAGVIETLNADGSALANATIYLHPRSVAAGTAGNLRTIPRTPPVTAETDADGVVALTLARGVTYAVSTSETSIDGAPVITIPDASTFTAQRVRV